MPLGKFHSYSTAKSPVWAPGTEQGQPIFRRGQGRSTHLLLTSPHPGTSIGDEPGSSPKPDPHRPGGYGEVGSPWLCQPLRVVCPGHPSALKEPPLTARPDGPAVSEVQAGGGSGQGVGPACLSLGGQGHWAQDIASLSASVTPVTDFGSADPHDPVLTPRPPRFTSWSETDTSLPGTES